MRKQYFKFISIILTAICIILSTILIFMKTYAFKNDEINQDVNAKVLSEIDFVDSCIVEAMNKMNNISVARYKVYTKTLNKPEEDNPNSENNGENSTKNPKNENNPAEQKNESKDSSKQEENQAQTNSQTNQLEEKNEIYVSQAIATNSLTETQDPNINWDEITYIYENLYSIWPTIKLDLHKAGIRDEQINIFSQGLNGVAQAINLKDKNSTLVNFYNIYSQIPNYLPAVTQDIYTIINYNTKVAVLNAYTLVNEENKWNEINESVARAKKYFSQMLEVVNENDNRRANIEKTNTIIRDFENSIVLTDKNIFYMQYKNTIHALETLWQHSPWIATKNNIK